jgi:hypothetical protein
MSTKLQPHIKLVCPICGQTLGTVVKDIGDNVVTWVLSTTSQDHLDRHE